MGLIPLCSFLSSSATAGDLGFTASEAVTVAGTPRIVIDLGGIDVIGNGGESLGPVQSLGFLNGPNNTPSLSSMLARDVFLGRSSSTTARQSVEGWLGSFSGVAVP